MDTSSTFGRFARRAASAVGHPLAFSAAAGTVVIWAGLGPMFRFGEGWQLAINSMTTIVTFLVVFLIQHTQNRDSAAMQIKLDELIRSLDRGHESLFDLEELTERELNVIRKRYESLAERARNRLSRESGSNASSGDEKKQKPPA